MAGKRKQDDKESSSKLRAEAEKKVRSSAVKSAPLKKQDLDKLVQELQVHQIELEMQNEELHRTQEQLQASKEQYFDLYDLAPIGYFSLSEHGMILETNLTGANMLGALPRDLRAQRFSSLIFKADQDVYYLHRQQLFKTRAPQLFEMRMVRRDGSLFWARIEAALAQDGRSGKPVCHATMSDITDRKNAEEALAENEAKYRNLVENASEGICVLQDGLLKFVNRALSIMAGDSVGEMTGRPFMEYVHPEDRALIIEKESQRLQGKKFETSYSFRALDKMGRIRWLSLNVSLITWEGKPATLNFLEDITNQKQSDAALQVSNQKFSELFKHISSGVAIYEAIDNGDDFIIRDFNPAAEKIEKVVSKDILAKRISAAFPGVKRFGIFEVFQRVWRTGNAEYFPENLYTDNRDPGSWRENWVFKLPGGEIVAVYNDVSERKQAQLELLVAHDRLALAHEAAGSGAWDWEMPTGQLSWSDQLFQVFGLDPAQATASFDTWRAVLHPEDRQMAEDLINQAIRDHTRLYSEYRIILPTGEIRWIVAMGDTRYDDQGEAKRMLGICIDITDRKQAEEAILRSKLLLQSVIDSTPDWMYVKDPQHKYLLVNKSFAEAQKVAPQDMIGRPDTDFFPEELCLGNPAAGIIGLHANDMKVLQGQLVHIPRNILTWADGSLHIYDSYKIPLTDQSGKIYGVLVYSRDFTERQRAEDERETALGALRRTVDSMISTMSKIVEMRDPYTAGHQTRVAELAGAIARRMKLDDLIIDHLVMAARIHDIGKMYVPSDILNKPGKLADIELDLIKTHVQGSYDILRDIEFSQPVARMALQHHERLDGSGYPNGLKGEDILIEAKILAVADVVEAMASHRPYRPALGAEKALEEISKNRGRLYDADVVDACLEIFSSGKFEFKPV